MWQTNTELMSTLRKYSLRFSLQAVSDEVFGLFWDPLMTKCKSSWVGWGVSTATERIYVDFKVDQENYLEKFRRKVKCGRCYVPQGFLVGRGNYQGGGVDRLNHQLDHHDHHHNLEESGQPDQCLHHRARSRWGEHRRALRGSRCPRQGWSARMQGFQELDNEDVGNHNDNGDVDHSDNNDDEDIWVLLLLRHS